MFGATSFTLGKTYFLDLSEENVELFRNAVRNSFKETGSGAASREIKTYSNVLHNLYKHGDAFLCIGQTANDVTFMVNERRTCVNRRSWIANALLSGLDFESKFYEDEV